MNLRRFFDITRQPFQSEPLVEISGYNRILIENYMGILLYSQCLVQVQLSLGNISVSGTDLRIMQISKEQLVITGHIHVLQLEGR